MKRFWILLLTGLNFSLMGTWDSFVYCPSMNEVYHPVTTNSLQAQEAFNRGLLALYAFNHDEAYRSFQHAADLDPRLAMAYWGMALSMGENINSPMDPVNQKPAFDLVQKALSLAQDITSNERAYIEALSTRYSADSQPDKERLRRAYSEAMKKVMEAFPDDLDAATLYAESLMDLAPWQLWTPEGEPTENTEEIVSVLDSVLKRSPEHLGANHYYIHAIEASPNPQKALICAYRLDGLLPNWGHVLHMPSHIYLRVGDYEWAVVSNKAAVEADWRYINEQGVDGHYPIHYLSHNLFFLGRAYLWQERDDDALATAFDLEHFLTPYIKKMPELEYYMLGSWQTYLYFHRWKDILEATPPLQELPVVQAFWRYARAMAYSALGEKKKAEEEGKLFEAQKEALASKKLGYNPAQQVLDVASDLLAASFAKEAGDHRAQIGFLRSAVKRQDLLNYNEPPDWYYPVRETLGAVLIQHHHYEEAEHVFRESLELLPRHGRSLFGLSEALRLQKRPSYWIEREMQDALKYLNRPLQVKDL